MLSERQRLLLQFIASEQGDYCLDQIRVMKGMFLLSQEHWPIDEVYSFVAYDYGPFDADVYRDLDALAAHGLIEVSRLGERRRGYAVTSEGASEASTFVGELSDTDLQLIGTTSKRVTSQTFESLLNDVYSEFPSYAKNSVLRNRSSK